MLYISFSNTYEKDDLTLIMATNSRMTQKAVVVGTQPLVYSESVNFIPVGSNIK